MTSPALTITKLAQLAVQQERSPDAHEALLAALYTIRRLFWQPRPLFVPRVRTHGTKPLVGVRR
jgi:hypothetical protein